MDLGFFNLRIVQKQYTFVRNHILNSEFESFLGLVIQELILFSNAMRSPGETMETTGYFVANLGCLAR
jgi:hypothetical protein